jgi:hypothetical protein
MNLFRYLLRRFAQRELRKFTTALAAFRLLASEPFPECRERVERMLDKAE